jgi:PAS domain S-box-containing protein
MGRVDSGRPDMTSSAIAPDVLLGAIVEMSNDAIVTCNAKGSVTSWSATAERLFGCLADDVLDGPLELLFPEHLTDEVRRIMATVLAGDRIRNFETEILRPDGMPLPVSLSLSPVFDAERVPLGAVVLARDITEQHLAQATLAEIDARMEEGEALAHIGSWLWDLRTGAVQWSAEFHRIHGVDPLDFDGTFESHVGLIHPEDREAARAAMIASVESGRQFNGEYRVLRPDGETHVIQVRAKPTLGSSGKALGLRGIGQDITPADRRSASA